VPALRSKVAIVQFRRLGARLQDQSVGFARLRRLGLRFWDKSIRAYSYELSDGFLAHIRLMQRFCETSGALSGMQAARSYRGSYKTLDVGFKAFVHVYCAHEATEYTELI